MSRSYNDIGIQYCTVEYNNTERVQCLIMEGMIIYMLDDVEYPLPKTTLQKMLDHKRYGLGLILYRAPCAIKGVLSKSEVPLLVHQVPTVSTNGVLDSESPELPASPTVETAVPTVSTPIPTGSKSIPPITSRVRPIGTKWVLKNKKDARGIVIRNKSRLVAQGHTQEEGIDYEEVFAPVAKIEAIRLFLAYASYMGFTVYQMDVESAFLYGTIDEEVMNANLTGFRRHEFLDKVYRERRLCMGLHQALSLVMYYKTMKASSSHKQIKLFILKNLGNSEVKDSQILPWIRRIHGQDGPGKMKFNALGFVSFLDEGFDSLAKQKQTIMATSTTKAEYVTAASGYG
ncbi:copia protein [Tanacetum coccineum]